jgi:hypothetical protein
MYCLANDSDPSRRRAQKLCLGILVAVQPRQWQPNEHTCIPRRRFEAGARVGGLQNQTPNETKNNCVQCDRIVAGRLRSAVRLSYGTAECAYYLFAACSTSLAMVGDDRDADRPSHRKLPTAVRSLTMVSA